MKRCDSEDRKEVFAWYGGAMYHAQCFEVKLHTLILFAHQLSNPNITYEELDKIDHKLSKKNLNYLINELKKHGYMHPELEELLHEFREKRNYLAHEFYFENSYYLLTKEDCKKMIEKLEEIDSLMIEADKVARIMSKNLRIHLGISEEQIKKIIRSTILNETRIDIEE